MTNVVGTCICGKHISIPDNPLITMKEACDILKVHPNTLRNWERDGKIKSVRIGSRRDRRYHLLELGKVFSENI